MLFVLPDLPYSKDALHPCLSAKTFDFHHGKHHQAYITKTNELVAGTSFEGRTLREIILDTAGKADQQILFNNVAQSWNHSFYWQSMKPCGGGTPVGPIEKKIIQTFGSYENFAKTFVETGTGQFGSGWVWLVLDNGALKITKTANADNPLPHGQTPLLTADVWEHAYYLDYQNKRPDYLQMFLNKLVNWDFANEQLHKE